MSGNFFMKTHKAEKGKKTQLLSQLFHVVLLMSLLLISAGCLQEAKEETIEAGRSSSFETENQARPAEPLIEEWRLSELKKLLKSAEIPRGPRQEDRLLIIGLDGFTPYFFDKLMEEGRLPNLQKIMQNGLHGTLDSTVIPSSVTAWTSGFTGMDPDETGIRSFFRFSSKDYRLRLVNSGYRRTKALWEYLDEAGKTSVVINVPGTYPPDPVKGVMISGLLSPDGSIYTHPPQLSALLNEKGYMTSYRSLKTAKAVFDDPFNSRRQAGPDIDDLFTLCYNRAKLGLALMETVPWNLFFIAFTIPDRLQHSRHIIPQSLLDAAYENLDRIVGIYLKTAGPATPVMIFSDHGFKEYRKMFLLNHWLRELGLLELKNGKIDYPLTQCFGLDCVGNYVTLRFNLKGRDARGAVSPDEFSDLINTVEEAASNLIEPNTGERIITSVIRSVDACRPEKNEGADMIFILSPEYKASNETRSSISQYIVYPKPPIYDHAREGYYFIKAEQASPGVRPANIQDMASTAMYLLGRPVPVNMTGRILVIDEERGQEESLIRLAVDTGRKHQSTLQSDEETAGIVEYLKSLGYAK